MRLSLDIETRSEADLKRVGLYKYAEDPTTEVLMLCYQFGGLTGPVNIWLPWSVEAYPESFITKVTALLTDGAALYIGPNCPPDLQNHIEAGGEVAAHNAAFERIVLNGHAGQAIGFPRLKIEQMVCTAIKSAAHGLPRALEFAAKALGTYPKKALGVNDMRALSKPRRGKDKWYTPENDPERWVRVVDYCIDDVKAESDLDGHLDDLSAKARDDYSRDQRMNDFGVYVDIQTVRDIKYMVAEYRAYLRELCVGLTGFTPGQNGELANWVRTHGYPDILDLQAETVNAACKDPACPDDVKKVLRIYSTHNMKTVDKFDSIENMICADGRLHGLFLFYGAHCVPGDTEVLTRDGWCRLDQWRGGDIVQVRPDLTADFLPAEIFIGPLTSEWLHLDAAKVKCSFTPGHTFPTLSLHNRTWTVEAAGATALRSMADVPLGAMLRTDGAITADQMRVLVMIQADGHFETDSRQGRMCAIFVKKPRKIARARKILAAAAVPFRELTFPSHPGFVRFVISHRDYPAWLSPTRKFFGAWLLDSTADARRAFVEELPLWDGERPKSGAAPLYGSAEQQNAEWAATMMHITGRSATHHVKKARRARQRYQHGVVLRRSDTGQINKSQWKRTGVPMRAYCAKTQTGFWLARANGRIFVTGNTGRWSSTGVQLQNLSRGHIPDPEAAIDACSLRDLGFIKQLYPGVDTMKVFSSCIRGVLIAPPGKVLAAPDYAGIESRITTWLFDENWKLAAFRKQDKHGGPDNYQLAMNRMFGYALVGMTKKVRNAGKAFELSMGFEGGFGALVTMADTYGVDLNELAETIWKLIPQEVMESAHWMLDNFGKKSEFSTRTYLAGESAKIMWRKQHPAHVAGWKHMKAAAVEAVKNPGKVFKIPNGKVMFGMKGDALGMRLPSGEKIWYREPEIIGTGTRESVSYMGINSRTKQWERQTTYGGKLCLAADTEVLTPSGWKVIQRCGPSDQVWDGEAWVSHAGLISQGYRSVINYAGISLTPDHEVMTHAGWKAAVVAQSEGLDWADVRIPDRSPILPQPQWQDMVVDSVQVRSRERSGRCWAHALAGAFTQIMRMRNRFADWREIADARTVTAPSASRMAKHARSLHQATAFCMDAIRRSWDTPLRVLADIRKFLAGYGAFVPYRAYIGAPRQQPGLFQTELLLGHVGGPAQQQAYQCLDYNAVGFAHYLTSESSIRNKEIYDRRAYTPSVARSRTAETYDLMNAGPLRRFTVRGRDGQVLLVHNCENYAQGFAAELIKFGMAELEKEGLPSVMSVHDEAVTEIEPGRWTTEQICEIFTRSPSWAGDLPLAAECWIGQRYRK